MDERDRSTRAAPTDGAALCFSRDRELLTRPIAVRPGGCLLRPMVRPGNGAPGMHMSVPTLRFEIGAVHRRITRHVRTGTLAGPVRFIICRTCFKRGILALVHDAEPVTAAKPAGGGVPEIFGRVNHIGAFDYVVWLNNDPGDDCHRRLRVGVGRRRIDRRRRPIIRRLTAAAIPSTRRSSDWRADYRADRENSRQ